MGGGRFCTLWLLCIVAVWSNTEHRRVHRSSINVVQLSSRLFMEAHGKSSIQDHTSRKRWSLSSARRTTRLGKCYHRSGHRSGHRGKASTELFARRGPKPGDVASIVTLPYRLSGIKKQPGSRDMTHICMLCDEKSRIIVHLLLQKKKMNLNNEKEYTQATPQELGNELETVFFGGGTPSLAPPQFIADVLTELDARYGISTSAEISMEMDPEQPAIYKVSGFRDHENLTIICFLSTKNYVHAKRVRENASQLHHPNLEELTDKVMLGLRLREGLDIESIGIHYGTNVVDSILEGAQTAITMGHAKVEIDPNSGNIQRLRLVDPDGFMISSEIIANIFSYLN
eukprot:jgi/Bigna1/74953/fgenesh1_pg.31_\